MTNEELVPTIDGISPETLQNARDALSAIQEEEKLDPKAVEQEMLKKSGKALSDDPAELAATLFTLYLPRFHAMVDQRLSSKALRRVLKALIEGPLADAPYNFSSQDEKEVYAMGMNLLDSRFMMTLETYRESLEVLNEAARNPIDTTFGLQNPEQAATIVTEETKGETNGS